MFVIRIDLYTICKKKMDCHSRVRNQSSDKSSFEIDFWIVINYFSSDPSPKKDNPTRLSMPKPATHWHLWVIENAMPLFLVT